MTISSRAYVVEIISVGARLHAYVNIGHAYFLPSYTVIFYTAHRLATGASTIEKDLGSGADAPRSGNAAANVIHRMTMLHNEANFRCALLSHETENPHHYQ